MGAMRREKRDARLQPAPGRGVIPLSNWLLFLVIAFAAISQWPVLVGRETFCFRDVGTTHRPAFGVVTAEGLTRWNGHASFGQPLRDNPNLLLRYPTVHAPRALGIHLFAHFVIGLIGMRMFLRQLGCSADGAVFGATAFSLSGYALSSVSFLNAYTALGWMQWLLYGAVRMRDDARLRTGFAIIAVAGVLLVLAGEPVLAAMTVLVAVALAVPRPARALAVIAAFGVSVAATSPVLLDVVAMARDSRRLVTGYDFEQAASASLHGARLLETIVPFLFGRPDRILAGAWWGFRISRDEFPYVYSVALGVIPLAVTIATLRFDRRRRFWIVLAAISLLAAFGGYLPGARALHAILPFGALRYPIKAFCLTTLAIAVLSAFALDDLRDGKGCRRRAGVALFVAAMLLITGAFLTLTFPDATTATLARTWWDAAWRNAPADVIEPLVAAMPTRLFYVAFCLLAAGYAVMRQRSRLALAILVVLTIIDLATAGRSLLPRGPSQTYDVSSSFVRAAADLRGRVFERAGKDLDAVRRGLYGTYPADDVRWLIDAQATQGWALSGAPHGLRYAYDRDPDGSYTWRNDLVSGSFDRKPWDVRLRWLRAAGVRGVIGYRLPVMEGVTPIATSPQIGVSNQLYRIDGTLPEVRRVSTAIPAQSISDAIATFEAAGFDWSRSIVVEDGPAIAGADPYARVADVRMESDFMACTTAGSVAGYVFVARSFSSRTSAILDGRRIPVVPANAHLVAVLVPSGTHRLRIDF
jgi:hypothetical protein